jgi:Uma2 family endonuclease
MLILRGAPGCYDRDDPMGDPIARPYVTFSDYLEAEQSSDIKHEWFNGSVYAMSRGTPEHARLSARIVRLIGNVLPSDCEVYSSDMMLYVAEAKLSTYADGSVVCGSLETITVKKNGKLLGEGVTNPAMIIEVPSDATERYDREEKFGYFRALPSLHEYVLVSQDEVAIEVFRRPVLRGPSRRSELGDRWECETGRAGGVVTIHGCTIEVDSVYGARD